MQSSYNMLYYIKLTPAVLYDGSFLVYKYDQSCRLSPSSVSGFSLIFTAFCGIIKG